MLGGVGKIFGGAGRRPQQEKRGAGRCSLNRRSVQKAIMDLPVRPTQN